MTLTCDVCQPLEYYVGYWMRGSPQDDHIWLGSGINIFLDKKLFFSKWNSSCSERGVVLKTLHDCNLFTQSIISPVNADCFDEPFVLNCWPIIHDGQVLKKQIILETILY